MDSVQTSTSPYYGRSSPVVFSSESSYYGRSSPIVISSESSDDRETDKTENDNYRHNNQLSGRSGHNKYDDGDRHRSCYDQRSKCRDRCYRKSRNSSSSSSSSLERSRRNDRYRNESDEYRDSQHSEKSDPFERQDIHSSSRKKHVKRRDRTNGERLSTVIKYENAGSPSSHRDDTFFFKNLEGESDNLAFNKLGARVPSVVPPKDDELTGPEEIMSRNRMLYGCESDDEITELRNLMEKRYKLATQLKLAGCESGYEITEMSNAMEKMCKWATEIKLAKTESLRNKDNEPASAVYNNGYTLSELNKISMNAPAMETDSKFELNLLRKSSTPSPAKEDSTKISFWKSYDQSNKIIIDDNIIQKIIAQPKKEASSNKVFIPDTDTQQLVYTNDPQLPRINEYEYELPGVRDSQVQAEQKMRMQVLSHTKLNLLPPASHYPTHPGQQSSDPWGVSHQQHLQHHTNVVPIISQLPTFNCQRSYQVSQITSTDVSPQMCYQYQSPTFQEPNGNPSGIHTKCSQSFNVSVDDEEVMRLSTNDIYMPYLDNDQSENYSSPIMKLKFSTTTSESKVIHTENCDSDDKQSNVSGVNNSNDSDYDKQDSEDEQFNVREVEDYNGSEHDIDSLTGRMEINLKPLKNQEKLLVSINLARLAASTKVKEVLRLKIRETITTVPNEESIENLTTSVEREQIDTPITYEELGKNHTSVEPGVTYRRNTIVCYTEPSVQRNITATTHERKAMETSFNVPEPMGDTDELPTKQVKNINPNVHSLKMVTDCQVCDKQESCIVSHYVNNHPDSEVITSRLAPDVADYLRKTKKHKCERIQRGGIVKFHQCCYFCNKYLSLTKYYWKNHIAKHTGYYQSKCSYCSMKFADIHSTHMCKGSKRVDKIPQPRLEYVDIKGYICDMCNYVRFNKDEIEKHLRFEHELDVTNLYKEVTFLCFPNKKFKVELKNLNKNSIKEQSKILAEKVLRSRAVQVFIDKRKEDASTDRECTTTTNQVKPTAEKLSERKNLDHERSEPENKYQVMVERLDPVSVDEGIPMTRDTMTNDDATMEQIKVVDAKDGFESTDISDLLTLIDGTDLLTLFNSKDEVNETDELDLLTFIDDYLLEWPKSESDEPDIVPKAEQLFTAKAESKERDNSEMVEIMAWNKNRRIKSKEHYKLMLLDISLYALYKCMDVNCGFTTDKAESMMTHLGIHEKSPRASNTTTLPSYLECAYCDEVVDTCARLVKHIQDEHESSIYQCPYCFYRSCVTYNVVVHLNQFHQPEKKSVLVCNGKPKCYATEKALIQKCLIENVRPLRCFEDCNKVTYVMDYFVKHMINSTAHTDHFKCQFCGVNTLISKTAKHLLVHGVGVYECVYCPYVTNEVNQIQNHMCNAHPSNLLYICVRLTRKNRNLSDEQLRSVQSTLIFDLDQTVDEKLLQRCPFTIDQLSHMNPLDVSNSNETSLPSSSSSLGMKPIRTASVTSISTESSANSEIVTSSNFELNDVLSYKDLEKDYMADDWDKYFSTLEYITDDWDKYFATLSTNSQPSTSKRKLSITQAMLKMPESKKIFTSTMPEKKITSTSTTQPDLLQDDIDIAAYFLVKGTGLESRDLYRCSFVNCEKRFDDDNLYTFYEHLRGHNQCQVGFKCYHCSTVSKNIVGLKYHIKVHGIHRYICFYCTYTSAIVNDIQKHMHSMHHRADVKKIPLNPKKINENVDLFVICPQGLGQNHLNRFNIDLIERYKQLQDST